MFTQIHNTLFIEFENLLFQFSALFMSDLKKAYFLPLKERSYFKIALMTFKMKHDSALAYLNEMIPLKDPIIQQYNILSQTSE